MYYMRRTIISFMLMFLVVGTVSAQQKIAEVAEELARSFPEECEMHGKNINGEGIQWVLASNDIADRPYPSFVTRQPEGSL